MKTLILCGGRGVFDYDHHVRIPKGMSRVGGRPVLWHVMKTFATFGHTDFVLALGGGGEVIRDYFLNELNCARDLEVKVGGGEVKFLDQAPEENWTVKLIDTGEEAQTGCRIARCRRFLEGERFFVTYSDCLCNLSLFQLLAHHENTGKLLTVTGVQPPSRFGTFFADEQGGVSGYSLDTKMTGIRGWINGGFMVMEPSIFNHVEAFTECSLEREVFSKLAEVQEVSVFPHSGYWQAVDAERDLLDLNQLYARNLRPWLPEAEKLAL